MCGISIWRSNVTGWERYYFLKSLQGDVLAIYKSGDTFTKVGEYTYDSWGNVLTKSGALADINPFRYRSYYQDAETGFYYLQSRYYDPAIGRWISPEANLYSGGIDSGAGFIGYNAYAYCANNPIIATDKNGEWLNIAIGAVVGGGLELAGQLLSGQSLSEVNWAKVGVSAVSGGLTAAVGPAAGCLISGATGAAMDALDGNINSWKDAVKSFAWGTAKAAISYGVGTAVGNATNSLTKVEKVGRMGEDGYLGVKYSFNKGKNGNRAIRSIELHPRHNGHGIHIQGNKWNPKTGNRSGAFFRKTILR